MQAAVSLQKLFNLLPIVWQQLYQGNLLERTSKQKQAWKQQLGILADAFKWGSACSRAVSQHWMLAMHKVQSFFSLFSHKFGYKGNIKGQRKRSLVCFNLYTQPPFQGYKLNLPDVFPHAASSNQQFMTANMAKETPLHLRFTAQILIGLPDTLGSSLPPEVFDAASKALSNDSGVSDEARQVSIPELSFCMF